MPKIRFAMALHNHQPIGNFDGVIEQAYDDSYLPFLEVMEKYPEVHFSLHTSGCLMEWIAERRPEYVERVRKLVDSGQVEIMGGGFYEPILTMIPARDRQGQIRGYSEYLHELFGCRIRGMWVPERVWEQSLVSDIVAAGIEYTVLDDYHFRKAGLGSEQLHGFYLSEDQGQMLRIFPGSEPMRYCIPFREVDDSIAHLRAIHQQHPEALVVFADDGEKLGTWPGTKDHVYGHGWIYRFLDALRANRDWIEPCTLSEALDQLEPLGRIYLPDCSYREMTEWALPADRLVTYERLWHGLEHQPEGNLIKEFMKGGQWRNFRVKYPEANEMYARMMQVSRTIDRVCRDEPAAFGNHLVHEARQQLYRGQCNCAYWHGAFGGLYLPHLRNAVYSALINAEARLLEFESGPDAKFVRSESADLNLDGKPETRIENDALVLHVAPAVGGHLYELDVRDIATNLGATLRRRPEAYHEKVRSAGQGGNENVASIHDRVVFKQEGLDRMLRYDDYPRNSLVDHFFLPDVGIADIESGSASELGDFVLGAYRPTISRDDDEIALSLVRQGKVRDATVSVSKSLALTSGSNRLLIAYGLSKALGVGPLRFAVEFNFAALAAGADDRYYHDAENRRLGQLQSVLDLTEVDFLGLTDEWLGIDVGLRLSRPGGIWSLPIASVSQSEGGFELVHQSACVMPHWQIPASVTDWEVEISVTLDTARAEARRLAPVG